MTAIIEIQRDAAKSAGCAFWDARAAMGGPGAAHEWYCNLENPLATHDHVHLTREGYRKLADAMFAATMRSFEHYRKLRMQEGPMAGLGH